MAKPRRQKSEEQKPEAPGPGGVVLHQKVCLSIDMENRRIYGRTEMKIVIPECGRAALHAGCMTIRSTVVDGIPAEFEYTPQFQPVEDEICSVQCTNSAADAACVTYMTSLEKEMVPNLFIECPKSTKPINDEHDVENGGDVTQNSFGEPVTNGENGHPGGKMQNIKLVCIDYLIESPETGLHFGDYVLHTENQIRRAHCWFPCMDSSLQRCPFDLEFTVNSDLVAVSNGNLLYQILSKDDPPRKTYVYKLSVPVSAGWISFAVGPFRILADGHNEIISHFCLSESFVKLQNTVAFFHSAFRHYEDYLSTPFPLGSYKQVFIPPETLISSMSLGASMCIFSSDVLFDEKVLDQTIDTRVKLAYALARQWFGVYIIAEETSDEWLLDGLAGFLTDSFIKRFLGNNEARYRRYKANCVVSKTDISGATALSSPASSDLYGTQSFGLFGKIRGWKSIAVLQMLEKQMGPDSFRKILQKIVSKATDTARSMRTLSTKEFRHYANMVGNLERPFLKEFFPRWVESSGCPHLRMGLSYNKRRNIVELAVIRGSTAKTVPTCGDNPDKDARDGETGWPGMMSIRVHETDGMYDHPSLPMAGDTCQLLEVQCHSRLAAKRFQKPKKGSKADGSDDNADTGPTPEIRPGMDSPLLWIRVDPEMEYLAEILFHQPVQMWINQLEKDKDVVAQSQAIAALEMLPKLSFSVVSALSNFLSDTKAFWRVRIEAAYALALTASEETDWSGLLHLIMFFKSRRFDADTALPRPNDFRDVPEYFVLEPKANPRVRILGRSQADMVLCIFQTVAIPHAIALVREADKRNPREAVEFILQLLKYNDNSGNPYSDVYWLAALVQSIGELEFGSQSLLFLSPLLKRIDKLLQFDSFMPSYNGILTISCIRTLAQIALKMSTSVPLERVCDLIRPFRNPDKTRWKVRIEANKVLLDLEFYWKGLDAALSLFIKFLEEETSRRGEVKLVVHAMHLCEISVESDLGTNVVSSTLIALLHLLASRKAFNNVFLRHHLFCMLQIIARSISFWLPGECWRKKVYVETKFPRPLPVPPTIYGVPRVKLQPIVTAETCSEQQNKPALSKLRISKPQEHVMDVTPNLSNILPVTELMKETDTISNCSERRGHVLKIKVKQPASASKIDDHTERSRGGYNEGKSSPCNSISVDAPIRGPTQPFNANNQIIEGYANNQIIEQVTSSHDRESRMTAGSAKVMNKVEAVGNELQCTADSRKDALHEDQLSPSICTNEGEEVTQRTTSLQSLSRHDGPVLPSVMDDEEREKGKKDKKDKKRKRKRDDKSRKGGDDPEYLEHKRRKKEKKRLEKELAKGRKEGITSVELQPVGSKGNSPLRELKICEEAEQKVSRIGEAANEALQVSTVPKLRIKIRSQSIRHP